MRVAYLDCFAGIAGDMFLGALLEAGVPPSVLEDATAALGVGASLRIHRVDRSGISCTKVDVFEGDRLAEDADLADHATHTAPLEQHRHEPDAWSSQPKTQHKHKGGHHHHHDHHEGKSAAHDDEHAHTHEHEHKHHHTHGRSLTAIRALIQQSPLHSEVKALAIRTFELLGASEARIHNVPVDEIHFHEVGAVDAIVDIVASCAGIHHLGIGAWYSSPLNIGSGMVQCAHGNYPVPAPATADLLRGVPTYAAHVQKELVTPTGAALVRALDPHFGQQPAMRVERIGYGAGTRNPEGFPNVVRLIVGELAETAPSPSATTTAATTRLAPSSETVTVLETALDDASPQLLAFAAEQLLAHGALDVMLTPVLMKKGRPGTLLTVLCQEYDSAALTALLLRETPTLGVRVRGDRRIALDRRHLSVDTAYGPIRLKLGSEGDEVRNAAPEFEDCKAAALAQNVPLKQVQAAALAAYLREPQP